MSPLHTWIFLGWASQTVVCGLLFPYASGRFGVPSVDFWAGTSISPWFVKSSCLGGVVCGFLSVHTISYGMPGPFWCLACFVIPACPNEVCVASLFLQDLYNPCFPVGTESMPDWTLESSHGF